MYIQFPVCKHYSWALHRYLMSTYNCTGGSDIWENDVVLVLYGYEYTEYSSVRTQYGVANPWLAIPVYRYSYCTTVLFEVRLSVHAYLVLVLGHFLRSGKMIKIVKSVRNIKL